MLNLEWEMCAKKVPNRVKISEFVIVYSAINTKILVSLDHSIPWIYSNFLPKIFQ